MSFCSAANAVCAVMMSKGTVTWFGKCTACEQETTPPAAAQLVIYRLQLRALLHLKLTARPRGNTEVRYPLHQHQV